MLRPARRLFLPAAASGLKALAAYGPHFRKPFTQKLPWAGLWYPAKQSSGLVLTDVSGNGAHGALRSLVNQGTIWTAFYPFNSGDYCVPTTESSFRYRADFDLGFNPQYTGETEPTWPTELGGTVSDSGITWTCCALASEQPPEWVAGGLQFETAKLNYVSFGNPAALDLANGSPCTLMMLIKPALVQGVVANLFQKTNGGTYAYGAVIAWNGINQQMISYTSGGSGVGVSTEQLGTDWVLLTVVFSDVATLANYLNKLPISVTGGGSGGVQSTTDDLLFGCSTLNSGCDLVWAAGGILPSALSQVQIASVYDLWKGDLAGYGVTLP